MIELDSARWTELHHAFGSAEDVPRLLEHLPLVDETRRRELWIGLWHLLWRGGVTFPASLAAAPHLVAFAETVPADEGAAALHLAGAILSAPVRGESSPDLAEYCESAVSRLPALLARHLGEPWSPDTTQVLCSMLALAKHHPQLSGAILAIEPVTTCSLCGGAHATTGWTWGALAPARIATDS